MTNEQLVTLIKDGQREYFDQLWNQNQGIAYMIARRYLSSDGSTHQYTMEDNLQWAFLGLVRAVEGYDASQGVPFISYAIPSIRTAIRRGNGLDGRRRVERDAISLDEPMEGVEDVSRLDTIADGSLEDMAKITALEDTRRVVREAVKALPRETDRHILTEHYWNGRMFKDIALELGRPPHSITKRHSALLDILYRMPSIWRLEERTRYYRHKGYSAFSSSWSSTVEDTVLWRDAFRSRVEDSAKLRSGTDRTYVHIPPETQPNPRNPTKPNETQPNPRNPTKPKNQS